MQHSNESLVKRDLKHVWHPCTQMKDLERYPMIPIQSGKGVWLHDYEGNRYLDAVSSWWVNIFGHCNPSINQAIKNQLDTLEHVIMAGCTHESAVMLSEKLIDCTPPQLTKCFFADNGSCAVEAAMKMSFHYWQNVGKPKKHKFVNLQNSYHGETIGALSVGDVALYKETYKPLLLDVFTAPSPDSYLREPGETEKDFALAQFSHMEKILAENHEEIAAVIVEPLIQCAGNMRMYDPVYLTKLREACDRYDVHFIADEIAVGFGRTGTLFAVEQADITPDFMCLSKGITGGYLPLSVVMTTETIYDAFYADYTSLKAFLHSHSYTGNALATSAACATLDLFETDNVIEKNRALIDKLSTESQIFKEHPNVADVRQHGMVVAIELAKDQQKTPFPWQERIGMQVYTEALSKSMLLRPLGNVMYFMPPYVITEAEIELLTKAALESINTVMKNQ